MSAVGIEELKRIKALSDARRYREKADALRRLMAEDPTQFVVDSEDEGVVGLTHEPTGFRFHLPRRQLLHGGVKSAESYWSGFFSGIFNSRPAEKKGEVPSGHEHACNP